MWSRIETFESFAAEVGDGQKLALNSFSWGTFALHTPMESVARLWLLALAHLNKCTLASGACRMKRVTDNMHAHRANSAIRSCSLDMD